MVPIFPLICLICVRQIIHINVNLFESFEFVEGETDFRHSKILYRQFNYVSSIRRPPFSHGCDADVVKSYKSQPKKPTCLFAKFPLTYHTISGIVPRIPLAYFFKITHPDSRSVLYVLPPILKSKRLPGRTSLWFSICLAERNLFSLFPLTSFCLLKYFLFVGMLRARTNSQTQKMVIKICNTNFCRDYFTSLTWKAFWFL